MTDTNEFDKIIAGWETEADEDAGKFYTRATDGKGHAARANVRYPEYVLGMVNQMVAVGHVPQFKTPHDFIRHATVVLLKQYAKAAPAIFPNGKAIQTLIEVERLNAEEEQIRSSVGEWVRHVDAAIEIQAWTDASDRCDSAERAAWDLPQMWGNELVREVERLREVIQAGRVIAEHGKKGRPRG